MVDLVRTGRPVRNIARDCECHEQVIRCRIRQADLDEGRGHDGLTTDERDELRRENRRLHLEREILANIVGLVRSADRLLPRKAFQFMRVKQAGFPMARAARLLGVSPSGY